MKTAVEWYNQQLVDRQNGDGDTRSREEIYEQAKEMFENQIMDAYEHGQNNGYMYRDGNSNIIQAEQYYKETFKPE
jgi:hypothetical protein